MSDELQQEVERLKAENQRLASDVAGLTNELKEVRAEARDRRHENKSLTQQLGELAKERDNFKSRAEADPEGLRKQVAEVQGVVRAMKFERVFEKVARGLKINNPAKIADLVKLADYQSKGDEPDEAEIAETFRGAIQSRPWLVDSEPAPTTADIKQAPGGATHAPGGATGAREAAAGGRPGPGADRGQSLSSGLSQAKERPSGRL